MNISQIRRDIEMLQRAINPKIKIENVEVKELNELLERHERLMKQMTFKEQVAMAKETAKWATEEGRRIYNRRRGDFDGN